MELAFKQQEFTSGLDNNIFSVGKKWNFSWLSYVTRDANGSNVVYFAGGGSRTYTNTTDYLTSTRLTGDTTNGFTLSYPDGNKDVYGFVVTNNSGAFQKAFLTERWNASNQKTRLDYQSYNPASIIIRLNDVVDGDGRTNFIYYLATNSFSTNLISQVVDAFNRTNSLAYDSNGRLTNITDVAGLSSSFLYDTNDWVTNMTTPYGATSFKLTDTVSGNLIPNGRSVEISEPNGAKQLYLFTNGAPGVLSSYSTNQVPVTSPFTNTLENSSLDSRNSFHWDRLQYATLSTNYLNTGDISQLTTNDYLKAHMNHWLRSGTNAVGNTLSTERAPSPDGLTEGQKTWYDYSGKTNTEYEGTQFLALLVARVLPDGTTSYTRTARNDLGAVTNEVSTYSIGGTVSQRTNTYTYWTNNIDLLAVTNALGVQVSSNAYNSYHQVVTNFNALGEKTVYTYNANQQLTSVTQPSGLITTNYYDGSNQLTQAVDFAGSTYFRTNTFTYTNGLVYTQTDERGLTVTNTWDALQRLLRVSFPDGTYITNIYNNLDLVKTVDRMGFTNSFGYNAIRQKTFETNALGIVTAYGYCQCGALDYVTNALGKTEQLVTHYVYDNQGNVTSTFYPDGSGMTNKYDSLGRVTNTLSGYASVTNYFNNQSLLITSSNAFGRVLSATFDVLDRATNSVDANGVTIANTYDNLNRLLTRGYPDGGVEKYGYSANIAGVTSYTNQLGSNVVNYLYDAMGRKTNEVYPGIATNKYNYSAANDLLTLTDGKNQMTTWHYDQYGRATNKVDATSTEIFRYQYDADNRLTNRWSAAKGSTTYKYDQAGSLTNIVYPVSPAITLKYDNLSRLTNMVDAAGTTKFTYANQFLASEDGPWASDTVSYTYTNGLRGGLTLLQPSGSWTQSYGYDAGNRLQTLTSPPGTFTYTFKGPGNLVTNLALPNSSAITNAFDSVARLTGTWLKNSGGTILNSHQYGYNLAGQRTAVTNFFTNYVSYTYDLIGELKTATGKEAGGTLRLNEQFGYAYDGAGNLNQRTNNELVVTFNVNALNELSNVTRTATMTVAGAVSSGATNVTVNGSTAAIYADRTYARTNLSLTNGNNTFTAIATDSAGLKDTNSVTLNLPTPVSFVYDSNGNLTSDGRRGFDYDDENQLIRVTVTNSWKTEFTYDGKFRRRIRKDYTWSGSWVLSKEVHYVYDGNLVLQERDGSNNPTVTYTRGRDLSSSLQGAGGIGGLLARTDANTAYYHADGNGNITALIDGNQAIVAKYSYDPYGNTLAATGALADVNTYRFSSKEYHQPSCLLLYLYRAYDPNLQRWPNRDPLGEEGADLLGLPNKRVLLRKLWRRVSEMMELRAYAQPATETALRVLEPRTIEMVNLYAFVANSPTLEIDPDGRQIMPPPPFQGCGKNPCEVWPLTPGRCCRMACWGGFTAAAGLCTGSGPAYFACLAAAGATAALCSDLCPP